MQPQQYTGTHSLHQSYKHKSLSRKNQSMAQDQPWKHINVLFSSGGISRTMASLSIHLSMCTCVLSPQLPLNDSSGRWHWWWCYTVSGTRLPGRGWNHRGYWFVWRWGRWTKPSSCYQILEHLSPSHVSAWWSHFYCCRRSFHTDHRLDPEREEPNESCHFNLTVQSSAFF